MGDVGYVDGERSLDTLVGKKEQRRCKTHTNLFCQFVLSKLTAVRTITILFKEDNNFCVTSFHV